ncbi:hypothetical protein [Rothia nasisuis]|uniref:hypothetical protein n=1 Tax=Rothia nasisuis TaxID=2109647 RepID=UPI001F3B7584|nr:hypothetical protein [Rothia nasisuis]
MSLLTNRCGKGLSVLSVSTVLLVAGCSSPPQNFEELTAEEANAEHITALEGWIYPPADAEKARRGFVERCVKAAGGTYAEPESAQSLETAVYTGRSTKELIESGYEALPDTKLRATAEFDDAGLASYLGQGGQTFTVTFMEYSSGEINSAGCMAQSYEYIYGSAENGIKAALLAPQFGQAIAESLRADEKYIQLQSDWAGCMQEDGFDQATSTDAAVYAASLLDEKTAKSMLERDIFCRESLNFDSSVSDIKNSYYESVYQRLEQFSEELHAIHATASERVAADASNPQTTSPVTLPTPSESPSGS